jgi:hypothetical protein
LCMECPGAPSRRVASPDQSQPAGLPLWSGSPFGTPPNAAPCGAIGPPEFGADVRVGWTLNMVNTGPFDFKTESGIEDGDGGMLIRWIGTGPVNGVGCGGHVVHPKPGIP